MPPQDAQTGPSFSPAQPGRAETRLDPSKAASELKPEAYPLGYVEDFNESRTKLAGCFSILLDLFDVEQCQTSPQPCFR
jgi:hypothetical protein